MMEEIVKALIDSLVELTLVGLTTLVGVVVHKQRQILKTKLSDEQYQLMTKIAQDIYDYVEREYGQKLGLYGEEKMKIAEREFDRLMQKYELPYTSHDLKMQIEKIIKYEKMDI